MIHLNNLSNTNMTEINLKKENTTEVARVIDLNNVVLTRIVLNVINLSKLKGMDLQNVTSNHLKVTAIDLQKVTSSELNVTMTNLN